MLKAGDLFEYEDENRHIVLLILGIIDTEQVEAKIVKIYRSIFTWDFIGYRRNWFFGNVNELQNCNHKIKEFVIDAL